MRGEEETAARSPSVIRAALLALLLMCSLAAAVENVKEVLTTPGGWLSVGQGFSARASALALGRGGGGGLMGGSPSGCLPVFHQEPSSPLSPLWRRPSSGSSL